MSLPDDFPMFQICSQCCGAVSVADDEDRERKMARKRMEGDWKFWLWTGTSELLM